MSTFNRNLLNPGGFEFSIRRLPEFNEFVQSVSVPGIQTSAAEQPTPFIALTKTGDHPTFADLSVTFKINEDLGNYIEIFDWIKGVTFMENYSQYQELANNDITSGTGVYADGNLVILSSAKNPIMRIDFYDLHPVGISGFEFDTKDTEVNYMEATASFRFNYYNFTAI